MRIIFGIGVGFDANDNPIPPEKADMLVRRATSLTTLKWGGCFVTRGDGAWKSPSGRVVFEAAINIAVDTDDATEEIIMGHAEVLRELFSQSCVAVQMLQGEPILV